MVKEQIITDRYAIYNSDCNEVMATLPSESIHLSIYSPPFCGLYQYSSNPRDLSNCEDYETFFEHYDFTVGELFRLTMPGRITAVHCMDVPNSNTGCDNLSDFPGDIIRAHVRCRNKKCKAKPLDKERGKCGHGWWKFIARYSVWKEPLGVRNRTMQKNLAHQTIVQDSSRCANASADYLLVFRRSGENQIPIAHPEGLLSYAGERVMPAELQAYRGWTGKQTENRFSHWIWRQYASAFWDDIRIERVLPFKAARDEDDEKHVHPLQRDVIERIITLWSNPGDKVVTPFMGVGSEVYEAVRLKRFGIGIELKDTYFRQAEKNMRAAATDNGDGQEEMAMDFLPLKELSMD